MEIFQATYDHIPSINAMARVVFRKTYRDILSPEQMEYMMDWMYSPESLKAQMDGGHRFFIAREGDVDAGYASVRSDGIDSDGTRVFHLEKLYVMPLFQGTGLGRRLFQSAADCAREAAGEEKARLELNVNRNNPAVGFYDKLGMKKLRQGDFPIGKGFYMNDFIMGIDI